MTHEWPKCTKCGEHTLFTLCSNCRYADKLLKEDGWGTDEQVQDIQDDHALYVWGIINELESDMDAQAARNEAETDEMFDSGRFNG